MSRESVFQVILFSQFDLPVELRSNICKNYFPFLPNETNCLTVDELKICFRKSYVCTYAMYNSIIDNIFTYCLVYNNNQFSVTFQVNDYKLYSHFIPLYDLKRKIEWQTEEEIRKIHSEIIHKFREYMVSVIDSPPCVMQFSS